VIALQTARHSLVQPVYNGGKKAHYRRVGRSLYSHYYREIVIRPYSLWYRPVGRLPALDTWRHTQPERQGDTETSRHVERRPHRQDSRETVRTLTASIIGPCGGVGRWAYKDIAGATR